MVKDYTLNEALATTEMFSKNMRLKDIKKVTGRTDKELAYMYLIETVEINGKTIPNGIRGNCKTVKDIYYFFKTDAPLLWKKDVRKRIKTYLESRK